LLGCISGYINPLEDVRLALEFGVEFVWDQMLCFMKISGRFLIVTVVDAVLGGEVSDSI
jgi:hypothetical protein